MKQCTECKEWKDESEFHKRKDLKDGLDSWCKKCRKQKNKEYGEKNKEHRRIYNKKYNKENKEYFKKYYQKNKKDIIKSNKQYINSPIKYNSTAKIRKEIELYEEVKESIDGNLMCKCAYCGEWFEPTKRQIDHRFRSINKINKGEGRFYCSDECKRNCPIYRQILYQKDQKPASSREVLPELRQMVFERDNYTCCNCKKHKDELDVGLHCHHVEGILWEPLESADIDMCITLCENCHKEVHQKEGCGYQDMQCT